MPTLKKNLSANRAKRGKAGDQAAVTRDGSINQKQSMELSHSKKNQIEYMADLLLELKEMAREKKLTTLAGIIDLAYAEARLRSRDLD